MREWQKDNERWREILPLYVYLETVLLLESLFLKKVVSLVFNRSSSTSGGRRRRGILLLTEFLLPG